MNLDAWVSRCATICVLSVLAMTARANDCDDNTLYNGLDDALLLPALIPTTICNHVPGGGGPGTIRFYGRVVAGEDDQHVVGVDTVLVEVWDRETFSDTLLWSGYTTQDGCFDSGIIPRGSEQEPDVYLRIVLDNPAVRIDSYCEDLFEFTWAFKSDQDNSPLFFEDFTGDEIDFGSVRTELTRLSGIPSAIFPNQFIVITRAERWLRTQSGLNISLPKVIVRNPRFLTSSYNGDILVPSLRYIDWLLHNYAHFLQDQLGNVAPGECDELFQQTCPPWCAEPTSELAWQRGFADWFADMMLERLRENYLWDSGQPWQAGYPLLPVEPPPFEQVEVCPDDMMFPLDLETTPGMFTAFLHDLTDGQGDDFPFAQDDEKALAADNYSDCSRTGWFEIMNVVKLASSLPMTPRQFVADYAALYPAQRPGLYWTAYNIEPDFLLSAIFPDSQAPGAVPAAASRAVGSTPCIPLTVDPPPDDGTGACGYSWEWTMNPAGLAPDFTVDVNGSCALPGPVLAPGDWYVSIRAQDCASNWSGQYATFGPFEIRDCNTNGIVDACEVDCDENLLADLYDCDIPLNLCDGVTCGGNDCNGNLVPDDCDIADGLSEDCNGDGVPDDCQQDTVLKWIGGDDLWNVSSNWTPDANGFNQIPADDSDVCLENTTDIATIASIGAKAKSVSSVGTIVVDGTLGSTNFEVNQPSVIDGEIVVDGAQAVLEVFDAEVNTLRAFNSSDLKGKFRITDTLELGSNAISLGRAVFLIDNVLSSTEGEITIGSNATATANSGIFVEQGTENLYIESGGSFEFNGDGAIMTGFGTFENDGTFTRASGTGFAEFNLNLINRGQMDLLTGNLNVTGSFDNSGIIAGQTGTTLGVAGGTTFTATSELSVGTLEFLNGFTSTPIVIQGKLDLKDGIVNNGPQATVDASANVISYGTDIIVNPPGQLFLEPVLNQELVFNFIQAHGRVSFISGDPVRTQDLSVVANNLTDTSLMTVENTFTVGAAGGIRDSNLVTKGTTQIVPGGAQKTFSNCTWTNEGTIMLDNSFTLNGASTKLFNAPSGVIDLSNTNFQYLIVDQTAIPIEEKYSVENDGLITKSNGFPDTYIQPSLWNRGDLIAETGPILLEKFLRQTAGQTLVRGGAITLTSSPSRFFRLEGGSLGGTNSFIGKVENTGGSVQPAEGVSGTLTIDADYIQSGTGELLIQLEGPNPGVNHDQLVVTGLADIQGGRLKVERLNNYNPPVGTSYVILTGNSVQGAFAQVLSDRPFDVTINATDITITAKQPGDFDDDGDVDQDDVDAMAQCAMGPMVPLPPGCDDKDLDGDGDVDQTDFAKLQLCISGAGIPADPNCLN